MNILDRFEQSFERLVEGSVGRLFHSPIQPAEIGRKLERAMIANQVVSVGATLVPNEYRVDVHPQDMALFADYAPALCRQMERWLAGRAAEHGFSFVDRLRVQIVGDARLGRRAVRVTATITDRRGIPQGEPEAIQRTEVYHPLRQTAEERPVRLRVVSGRHRGQELLLRKPVTTIGRALDNDIVLEAGDVSRHHARFELGADGVRVTDLDSTNGTRVNGTPIRSRAVGPGDGVTFGSVTVELLPPDGTH